MTAKFFDLRLIAFVFVIVLVMMGVTMASDADGNYVGEGEGWLYPDVAEDAMPRNDCGRNYVLRLVFLLNGQVCEVTRGVAPADYVERLAESYKGDADIFATPIERALHYIEHVVWKYGGYSPK